MRRILLVLMVLPLLVTSGFADVDATSWKKAKAYILPSEREMKWTDVPWRASLWDAVIDANKDEKPILLWTMNGHPLACT